ncbi:hypothetical protein [Arthrobacter sp. zg-Y895]|uniref:hypothetical protein n=1 Tax=Arthrobacter sp. zg-Y895 TaxID=2886933 RepID=UPI001D140135|nr:hypothetical protein [Arthrobacter sp. zg-Y895]MCC3300975.1 hypothetical protein [Arthrobacter sp. zg-Y895]
MEKPTTLYSFLDRNYKVEAYDFVVERPHMALQFGPLAPTGFVEPTITGEDRTDRSPFMLISAPAAMGKSITSAAIASRLGCPLFDLAEVTVGADTHIGTLSSVLKMSSFADLIAKWTTGEMPIVIDSLDEAPLRSGERAYLAFLDSIIETARRFERPAGQIILLGRPQTIDFFSGYCESNGVPAPVWSLEALTLTSALDLIDIQLTQRLGESAAHRLHREPARRYWQDYLLRLGGLIAGNSAQIRAEEWGRVADFLGYPPVVAALAPTLERNNYSIGSYADGDRLQAHDRTEVLVKILEQLTDRESLKVQTHLAKMFGERLDKSTLLAMYAHEEQLQRVLGKLGYVGNAETPAVLPDSLRGEYESSIDSFVDDHPFLNGADKALPRNVVFSDYVRALLDCEIAYIPVGVSSLLPHRGLLPIGPFYARFVHYFSSRDGGVASLPSEDLVDDLVKSWQATVSDLATLSSSYHHVEDKPSFLELVRWPVHSTGVPEQLDFEIVKPSGVLVLTSPISGIRVSTDHAVSLAPTSGNLALGPNVSINAVNIEASPVQEVIFFGSAKDHHRTVEVALIANQLDVIGDFKMKSIPATAVAVVVSNNVDHRFDSVRPRFKSYANVDPRNIYQAVLNLRRIFSSFRGALNINSDRFNRYVVGRSPMMKALADSLFAVGLMQHGGESEALNLNRLSEFGVSYGSLQTEGWEEKCFLILEYCIQNDSKLRAVLRKEP